MNILLDNICKEDAIEVSLYEKINDAVMMMPFYKETTSLESLKNNFLKIFDFKKTSISLLGSFIVGLKIIPAKNDKIKHQTSVVTVFQAKETQIYYQKEKDALHKMPNEHYLKYFNAYPLLVKTIIYGK